MTKTTPDTILLRGKQFTLRREGIAAEAITPGMLVKYDSTGKVIKHATAGGAAALWVAFENELFGLGIDDAYAANDQVLIECVPPGGEAYMLVAPSAAAIVIGDGIESTGNGYVRKLASGVCIGYAASAVDNSSNGVTAARVKVAAF